MLRRHHAGREHPRNRIEGMLRGSPPAISERGLIGDLRTAAQTWWIVQGQTGGNEGGLFARVVDTLDRQTGPRRCGVQHLSPAAARHHLPPFYYPYLRDRVRPWRRVDGLRVHLGHHRLVARYRPLGSRLHPARPDTRAKMSHRQRRQTATKREGGDV